MQFTKVHQDLAKPVYEAIPKIAEKAGKKWEWELKGGDNTYIIYQHKLWLFGSYGGGGLVLRMISDSVVAPMEECIPLLHWERIVKILEGMGYTVKLRDENEFGKDCRYNCGIYIDKLGVGRSARDFQEAVQRGILALVEKLEARKEA